MNLVSDSNLAEHASKPERGANPSISDDDPLNARILSLVADLGNTVLAKRAAGDLLS